MTTEKTTTLSMLRAHVEGYMALDPEYWTGRACGECELADDECLEDREDFSSDEWIDEGHMEHCHWRAARPCSIRWT